MGGRVLSIGAGVAVAVMVVAGAPAHAQADGDESKFCKAVTDVSLLFNTFDFEEGPTAAEQRKLNSVLDRVEQYVPSELETDVETAVAGVREGNFEDPAVGEAANAIDGWVADNCDYNVVEVTAREYEFEGIPNRVGRGITIFQLTNEGEELHEIAIMRIKGDETVHELLELPERQAEKKVEFVAGGFAAQGDTGYAYANLKKPGRYAALCFVPVGSTDEAAAEASDGPSHAAEGMVAEFRVTKQS